MGLLDEIREQPECPCPDNERERRAGPTGGRSSSRDAHAVMRPVASDNASRYAQYVWGTRNGLSVGLTTLSLLRL